MLEHIHCNKCFRLDPVKDVSYWLTNCGHIICQQCLDRAQTKEGKKRKAEPDSGDSQEEGNIKGSESICTICKKPCECINIPEGVDDLPEAIQPFFRPLANLCNTTLDTWKFQEQNFTKLIDHLQARTKRQNEILTKARTELLKMKAMKSENQTIKEENEKLKLQIQELKRHHSGGGRNAGHGSGVPITPVTPQIRVMNPSADRIQPPTSSRDNQQHSGREEPDRAKRTHESQLPPPLPPPDPRTGGGDTGVDLKRTRSATSNVGNAIHASRLSVTPRPPPATERISLVSYQQPGFMSPRLTLTHQPSDVLQSPRRPPSVHTVHHIAQPRYPNVSATIPRLPGVGPPQAPGFGDHIAAVPGGQNGYGYQRVPLPVQGLSQEHVYPIAQPSWPSTSSLPQAGVGYQEMLGTGQAHNREVVAHDPLIRMRSAASAARTTWQQQQQQQQQLKLQQQQHLQRQQLHHQQYLQQQHLQPQYGYPIASKSAVPRPVVPRTHYG
ncbi:hypothetical protein BGZ88_007541 [Linnemannia elongata]|nr:hypothetical protein BGZ88_007541 [Linnemannia elongata]